ncbi:group 3 secretory phospholipase A2-like [Haliotis asinina]|uniref:group 3 secretory phospholipase A2-like n=1 Tax=Haliotis asinina TaxID=109174 RepID=UPI0035325B74
MSIVIHHSTCSQRYVRSLAMIIKTLQTPGNLHVAFLLCLISPCLSTDVYKYFTTHGRDRLLEALFDGDGGYADCAVFGDRNVIGNILKEVSAEKIDEISKSDLDLYIQKCHEFHLTLDDSPLRRKRFAAIYPGTKWCGVGNISSPSAELGVHNHTDACCREHDYCPDYILPFTSKHGLYNFALYTRFDCACDKKFFQCLKASPDDAADNVGKIYFNLLSIKCMGYGYPQKCIKRWWFICLKYGEDKSRRVRKFTNSPRF